MSAFSPAKVGCADHELMDWRKVIEVAQVVLGAVAVAILLLVAIP